MSRDFYPQAANQCNICDSERKSSGGNKLSRLRGSENNDAFRVEDGRIVDVDEIETQRMENDMRRRFERILGAKSDV